MEFADPNSTPTQSAVAQELARLSGPFAFRHASNILLVANGITAQIDHVVVDRFGILIIDAEVRGPVWIEGRGPERRWIATTAEGLRQSFENPLLLNRQSAAVLHEAFETQGVVLDPSRVTDLAVFAESDLSRLEVDAFEARRTAPLERLEAWLAARPGAASAPGDLSPEQVAYLYEMLLRLDRSTDRDIARRARMQAEAAEAAPAAAPESITTAGSPPAASGGASAAATSSANSRPVVWAVIGVVGFMVVGACSVFGMRAVLSAPEPTAPAPIVAPEPVSNPTTPDTDETPVAEEPEAADEPVSQGRSVTTSLAKQELKKRAPGVYSSASNLDSPDIEWRDHVKFYTWQYLSVSENVARTSSYSIGFDGDGKVVKVVQE